MTDPIAAARALLDKVPPLFIDKDGDLCRAGDGHNLVGCAASDDVAPFDYLNPVIWGAIPDLRDMVPTLADALEAERAKRQRAEADRDQALARLAVHAATKPMVDAAFNALPPDACGMIGSGEMYRVLDAALKAEPPADAQAALDKMLAEARLEGWRAGRDAAAGIVDGTARYHMSDPDDIEVVRLTAAEIRALPEPKEAGHV